MTEGPDLKLKINMSSRKLIEKWLKSFQNTHGTRPEASNFFGINNGYLSNEKKALFNRYADLIFKAFEMNGTVLSKTPKGFYSIKQKDLDNLEINNIPKELYDFFLIQY